jgi:IS5 family transposase
LLHRPYGPQPHKIRHDRYLFIRPKATLAVDARGIPLGSVSAPANRHDSPLLVPTLEASSGALGALPEGASVHLDRGYDSRLTRERLEELGLGWEISGKGTPAPFWATHRWVVERTSSWHNAHKKLVWCTERIGRVIDFWVAFSSVVIIVRRLSEKARRVTAGRDDHPADHESY